MGDDVRSHIINISLLRELQQAFQKDICELIDIYLHDANRKIANLYKALNEANLENFAAAARELRLRSLDIGAIQFEQQLTPVLKALALIKNKAEETNSKVLF